MKAMDLLCRKRHPDTFHTQFQALFHLSMAWFAGKNPNSFMYHSCLPLPPHSPTGDPIPFSLQLIFGYILLCTPKFFPSWGLSPLSVPWSHSSSPNSAKTPLPPRRLPDLKTPIKGLLTPLSRANPFFCSFPETRFLLLTPSLRLQGAHTPGYETLI